MSDNELLAVFVQEATEVLALLGRRLIELETSPQEGNQAERVREIFRLAHTLKGSAATVGRSDFAELVHHLESCLDAVRKGALRPDKRLIDASLNAVDFLQGGLQRQLTKEEIAKAAAPLEAVRQPDRPASPARKRKAEPKVTKGLVDQALQLLAAAGRGQAPNATVELKAALEKLERTQEASASARFTRLLREVARALAQQGDALESGFVARALQTVDYFRLELEGAGSDEEAEALISLFAAPAPRSEKLKEPPQSSPAAEPSGSAPPTAETSVRIPVALLDAMLFRLDELVAARLRVDHNCRQVEEAQAAVDFILAKARGLGNELPEWLEGLKRRLEVVRAGMANEGHSLGILTQALQDDVKEVRMVPVGPHLDPMRRMVRDLAHTLGKEASLEITGEEVRVDKRLLELMRDPLMHLLRNAVDHGLEPPEERRDAGKPPRGQVRIAAEARESQVWIEIRDDGRGIDPQQVRSSAVKKGLVDADRARQLTDREALNLIFLPGFSTADQVSETSGRGVGLDVVRENVARLGGRIEFYSELGKSTQFIVCLPLTLAASRGLLVVAGRQAYCLPLTAVEEVVAIEPGELGVAQGHFAFQRRRQAIPFLPLAELLAGQPASRPTSRVFAVVLALSDRRLAVGVDELMGQEEVVVKGLAPGTPRLPFVSGATALADGRLVTVLEPSALVATGSKVHQVASSARNEAVTVLVADDALTSRTMVSSILERAGYRTILAPDGEAAWRLLAKEKVDLVVSDVEMPGLDGLGLTRRIRASASGSDLPVILITSLDGPEDRARGAAAGANGYLVKKDFQPGALLGMVRDFLGSQGGRK
ncbi:MAG: hybrid sensor histidine kinase/response regulator [Myxococcota bacterium]